MTCFPSVNRSVLGPGEDLAYPFSLVQANGGALTGSQFRGTAGTRKVNENNKSSFAASMKDT